MCNPRRIRVAATRRLNEAWQREVLRTVSLSENVMGEARVRQSLGATLGGPTLRALELAMAADDSGWTEVGEGYRYNVEGGYVIYLIEERALEIVATLADVVEARGDASEVLEGTVEDEISVKGEGRYYDDGWGGHTREKAEKAARTDAEQKLEEAVQAKVDEAKETAESQAAGDVEAQAHAQAEEHLLEQAAERREQLARRAVEHLETVGLRCRQAFHQVLARGYRDAILAYAKRNGAGGIQCHENGDVVDIEFCLSG